MEIKSPSVAPIDSFGTFQNHQYTVLPYYEMPALSEVVASGVRFSEEELRTRIIPSVIEGLRAVHEAGVLHRDLKPGNLIPDKTGEHIVLIDFGISSDAGRNTFVVTQTGMTPFYAAPEAMQGIFHQETDYYALGDYDIRAFHGLYPFSESRDLRRGGRQAGCYQQNRVSGELPGTSQKAGAGTYLQRYLPPERNE